MPKKKTVAKKKTRAKNPRKSQKKKDACFVIMPYGDWFDEYYSSIFIPAITSTGLEPHRADDLYRPSAIVNDIWEYTKSAKIILADLTSKNPNVFYELGLAHARAKPAVLVTASIDDVPFDLRGLRIIEYDKNNPNWGSSLQDDLRSAIRETLASPLSTVLPTFLNKPPAGAETQLSAQERALLTLRQDIDMLKRQVRTSSPPRLEEQGNFGPPNARQLIRTLLASGLDESDIFAVVGNLGAPRSWIRAEIGSVNRRKLRHRSVVRHKSPTTDGQAISA